MSRTIRRKGKVPDWLYDKTVTEFASKPVKKYSAWRDEWYDWYPSTMYYLPKEEWVLEKKQTIKYHGDMWTQFRKSWIKRIWNKKRRQWDRQEMFRTVIDEYEPIWFTTKIDTWWWD